MGTQGAPCPQHEDERVPLSSPCSSGSPRGLRREEDPALRRSSAHPHPPPLWGLGVKVPCRARWEQRGGGNSPGCRGRMELGSPAAAPGERKRCGVAWSLPVVLHRASPPCQVPQLSLRTGRRCSPEPPLTVVRCQQGCCERIQEGQPGSPGCGTPSARGRGRGVPVPLPVP